MMARGRGARAWDLEGREYIEYGMGLRAVTLGHAYPPVVAAASAESPTRNDAEPASLSGVHQIATTESAVASGPTFASRRGICELDYFWLPR